jgi:hypothetical protein
MIFRESPTISIIEEQLEYNETGIVSLVNASMSQILITVLENNTSSFVDL